VRSTTQRNFRVHCRVRSGALRSPARYRVGEVSGDAARSRTRDRRNGIDERQQLGNVVAVRSGQDGTDGDAIRIDENVMFGIGSRAIRGFRASFSPAPTARTDDESTAAREKSSWPASRNFASSDGQG
jgi:hypothetical protein